MNLPILYVLAGPNGIGKTTSFFNQFPINLSTINADEIAKQLREKLGQVNVQEIANGEATRQMNLYISKKESFGFETNLADLDTWRFLQNLQIIGYQICINFFSTDEVNLCIERVKTVLKKVDIL
jgi:predicted ABC-type ATPase